VILQFLTRHAVSLWRLREGQNTKPYSVILIDLISLLVNVSMTVAASLESPPWDVNDDGLVDFADLMFVGKHFGDSSTAEADVNGDGLVNIADLILVGVHFGEEYKPGDNEIIGSDGAPMVLIPAGEFQMGDAFNEGGDDELPVHTVYLDAFYMDKYEVTNAQYRKFVQATGHNEPVGYGYINGNWQYGFKPWPDPSFNGDNQPVVCVSWEDARAYADWTGKRLPTEAEWEKAVRGGLPGKRYVWGDEWPPPKDAGNFADETAKKRFPGWSIISGYDDGYAETAPVGSFDPNGYGLHDMAGNVWEWCQDWYGYGYYSRPPPWENPTGPDSGNYRVLRGGCWSFRRWIYLRVAGRLGGSPGGASGSVGFRCVSRN
jgi:formylglycine-generating enzyme required for sulfatase activity